MPDEPLLRQRARAAVKNGKLPARSPDRTWGRVGVGAACAVCEVRVTSVQMAMEIRFARDGDPLGFDTFHLHVRCFAAWEFERVKA